MSRVTPLTAIGLMSGTSMDGIDVALVRTDGHLELTRGPARTFPYRADLRRRIEAALDEAKAIRRRGERPGSLAQLEREITDLHGAAVIVFAAERGLELADIDVVGFHGQTVLHRPADRLTVQLGDGPRLAELLCRPVVYDMRAADMEAGGQGAPLVPAYHAALAAALPEDMRALPVAFVNIGGISNITWIDGRGPPIAFDTGPGNALLDRWVSETAGVPFDENGMIASEGGVLPGLAERYLADPFFAKCAPKSLDRLDFAMPPANAGSLEDVARTLCFVAARSILKAVEHLPEPPKLWVVGGGGRKHPAIMADLREGAAGMGARVVTAEDAGLEGDAIEAQAWAYLAVRSLHGMPLSWPTTTGCRAPTPGGVRAE